MLHIMFDIDGTLIDSYHLDSECFVAAVEEVTGSVIDSDWSRYKHVTDSGIVQQLYDEINSALPYEEFSQQIQAGFVTNLKYAIVNQPIKQIPGANNFLQLLKQRSDIEVSIATGGWHASAQLKLDSAGIDINGIPLASADDHYSRTEIMRVALRAMAGAADDVVYFGDGDWDEKASRQLGFRFIRIDVSGNAPESIQGYEDPDRLFELLNITAP